MNVRSIRNNCYKENIRHTNLGICVCIQIVSFFGWRTLVSGRTNDSEIKKNIQCFVTVKKKYIGDSMDVPKAHEKTAKLCPMSIQLELDCNVQIEEATCTQHIISKMNLLVRARCTQKAVHKLSTTLPIEGFQ